MPKPCGTAFTGDGELSEIEITVVCVAVIRSTEVDLSCEEALERRLDPNRPPSADELVALKAHLTGSAERPSAV